MSFHNKRTKMTTGKQRPRARVHHPAAHNRTMSNLLLLWVSLFFLDIDEDSGLGWNLNLNTKDSFSQCSAATTGCLRLSKIIKKKREARSSRKKRRRNFPPISWQRLKSTTAFTFKSRIFLHHLVVFNFFSSSFFLLFFLFSSFFIPFHPLEEWIKSSLEWIFNKFETFSIGKNLSL